MNRGIYRIHPNCPQWRIDGLMRLLKRDKMTVEIVARDDGQSANLGYTISAYGTIPRRKAPGLHVPAKPPFVSHETCAKQLAKLEQTVRCNRGRLRETLHRQWFDTSAETVHSSWYRRDFTREQRKAIGRAVAIIRARKHRKIQPEDYALLDAAAGRTVERQSKVSRGKQDLYGGYLGYIVRWYAGGSYEKPRYYESAPTDEEKQTALMVSLAVAADLDYWREMEALSGQREHFKPGRTAETVCDDEVAA